ncbi:ABC transporter substrate binding protein [uncultured Thiodictyon sp.]|uniref:ABC transporter substrate binding protein n=1 Tax=uncultured Thiodictyon sp. TaxID=1846217 RepID=UPI0025E81D26|nr:ABC transporter substrate binding protein [uncultured Thiodictyon sp.]
MTFLSISQAGAASNVICPSTPIVLVYPKISRLYEDVIAQIKKGLQEVVHAEVGVCSIDGLPSSTQDSDSKAIIAIGESAFAASIHAYHKTTVVPILVRELPPGAQSGISLFLDPRIYIQQLLELSPEVKTVTLIYRDDIPRSFLETVKAAAAAHNLRFSAMSVATIRDAALAVESVMRSAGPGDGVWFQRGVLGMNADILVPKIVGLSWEKKVPVFTDEADYVARGMLFALTQDYLAIGRTVANLIDSTGQGLRYAPGPKRVLNRRTAQAIGIALRTAQEKAFDYVYQ